MAHQVKMCWRHQMRSWSISAGPLMDLTGQMLLVQGKALMVEVRGCPACQDKGKK